MVESARALTGARNGAIATVDETGRPQDFVTSGLTPEEERRMAGWLPDGVRLFEHLRDLEAPLRCDDFPAYVRALGYSSDLIPCTTFQGTPMRHRGVHVGSFFPPSRNDPSFARLPARAVAPSRGPGSSCCPTGNAPLRKAGYKTAICLPFTPKSALASREASIQSMMTGKALGGANAPPFAEGYRFDAVEPMYKVAAPAGAGVCGEPARQTVILSTLLFVIQAL